VLLGLLELLKFLVIRVVQFERLGLMVVANCGEDWTGV
jgi:hypothetical protein